MSLISRSIVTLSLEDMTQMTVTVGTDHFCSGHSKRLVDIELESARDGFVEGWPTTRASKLGLGGVQRSITSSTVVGTVVKSGVVRAGMGSLGTLFSQNPELLRRQNSSPFAVAFVAHGGVGSG